MTHLWTHAEIIAARLTDDQIISFYLGEPISFSRKYRSPFRDDPNPSLAFYINSNGEIRWTDFGMKVDHRRDGIGFVRTLFNLTCKQAIDKIYDDIIKRRITPAKAIITTHHSTLPDIVIRNIFTTSELRYWQQYNISKKLLDDQQVYALGSLSYRGSTMFSSVAESPKFYYHFGKNSFKIYMPLEKITKFRSFNVYDVIEGYNCLPLQDDILIITSSTKDALSIKSIGFKSVISPTGETVLKNILLKYAEFSERFNRVYILLDNDKTGRNSTLHLEAYSNWKWKPIWINGAKDPSDLIKATSPSHLYYVINKSL